MTSELQRNLAPTPLMKCISFVWLPFIANFVRKLTHTGLVYPHEIFAALFQFHPAAFLACMLGGAVDRTSSFWSSMKKHPSWALHPELHDPAIAAKAVPITIHGDGVPVTGVGKPWSRSVEIISWKSLLSSGSTLMSTFLIFMFHKLLCCKTAGHNTMDTFWRHVVWSLSWLQKGKWPTEDADGIRFSASSPEGKRARENGGLLAGGWRAMGSTR